METVKFEAGRYYIGDPCYYMSDEQWQDAIRQTGCFGYEPFSANDENVFFVNGEKCWANGTAFGDGVYYSLDDEYWVDSGTLGIVPVSAVEGAPDFRGGYAFHTFDKPFEVWYNEGVFTFGNIVIDTIQTEAEERYA